MINTEEIWVNCKIESDIEYEISNLGNIRDKYNKELKYQGLDKRHNIKVFTVLLNGKPKRYVTHRILCKSFDENYDNGDVNHINGDNSDNRLDNLKYNKNVIHDGEYWRPLPINDAYEVSNFGRIRNIKNNRILITSLSSKKRGYPQIKMYIGSKLTAQKIHKLVMISFKSEEYFEGAVINHKDCDKLNNKLENLEWCTASENQKHAYDNNLLNIKPGIDHNISKLNSNQVRKIRILYKSETTSMKDLSTMFNVSERCISSIVQNKSWKHVVI